MSEYAERVILEIHQRIASKITRVEVLVRHDHLGPYISIITPEREDRRFTLDDGEAGDELTRYFWYYENRHRHTFIESRIGYKADDAEVLAFLDDCLTNDRAQQIPGN